MSNRTGTILCASEDLYHLLQLSSSVKDLGFEVAAAGSYGRALSLSQTKEILAIVILQSRTLSEFEAPAMLKFNRPEVPILMLVPKYLKAKGVPPGVDKFHIWQGEELRHSLQDLFENLPIQ